MKNYYLFGFSLELIGIMGVYVLLLLFIMWLAVRRSSSWPGRGRKR